MRKITFREVPTTRAPDRRHFVDEIDVRVVLSRLRPDETKRIKAVRFDDRGKARCLGYAYSPSGEITLCALPPRLSLNGVRGINPEDNCCNVR